LQIRLFLLFFVLIVNLFGNDFRDIHKVSLKKDEQTKIFVKYGSKVKLFKFRWTLYKNGGLVIHRSYDGVVSQNILYKGYTNQSFRLELKARGADNYNVPYFLVKFKEFDYEKNEAQFELYLSDEKGQLLIEYVERS
jgi:hypothetical protein